MKISGYAVTATSPSPQAVQHHDLEEITINASPAEVRKFAAFLSAVADDMDRMGRSYSHEHLADKQPGFDDSPHVTVFNSELEG